MSIFDSEDSRTVKSLALTFGGFTALTILLMVIAYFMAWY
jgi:hypothetical protein